jgi:hypothetical protein
VSPLDEIGLTDLPKSGGGGGGHMPSRPTRLRQPWLLKSLTISRSSCWNHAAATVRLSVQCYIFIIPPPYNWSKSLWRSITYRVDRHCFQKGLTSRKWRIRDCPETMYRESPTCTVSITVNESLVILGEVRSWPWAFVSWQGVISYNVGIHLARLEQLILCYGSPKVRSWKVTIIIQTLHSHYYPSGNH